MFTYVDSKRHNTWYLHSRCAGNGFPMYYFSLKKDGALPNLPRGFEVGEVKRNGWPYLKRSKITRIV